MIWYGCYITNKIIIKKLLQTVHRVINGYNTYKLSQSVVTQNSPELRNSHTSWYLVGTHAVPKLWFYPFNSWLHHLSTVRTASFR